MLAKVAKTTHLVTAITHSGSPSQPLILQLRDRNFLVLGFDLDPRSMAKDLGHREDQVAMGSIIEVLSAIRDMNHLTRRVDPGSTRGPECVGDRRMIETVEVFMTNVVVRVEDHRHTGALTYIEDLLRAIGILVVLENDPVPDRVR